MTYLLLVTWILGAGTGAAVVREPDRSWPTQLACEAAAEATRRAATDGARVLARCVPAGDQRGQP